MPFAFVTGASGFIGGRLVDELASRKAFDRIHCLVRHPAKSPLPESEKVRVFEGDVTDPDSLVPAMSGCEAAFHLAAWYELGIPRAKIPRMEAINIEGTRNVLTQARELGILLALERGRPGEQCILAGEVMEFGDTIRCVTEIAGSSSMRGADPIDPRRGVA